MEILTKRHAARLRRMARMPLLSPRQWLRRLVFWIGALVFALFALTTLKLR